MHDIHLAARAGNLDELIRHLDAGTPVDLHDHEEGLTPLMHACTSHAAGPDAIDLLIERGADLNATVRHKAIETPDFDDLGNDENLPEEMREMMKSMESLSSHVPDETSLISLAAKESSIEKIERLFKHGADPAYRSPAGYTLMIHACCACREDLIDLLLSLGAPIDGASSYSESALSVLSSRGRFDLVLKLLDAGADPSPLTWNTLHHAAVFGGTDEIENLLTRGADLEETDRWDRSPLLLAIHAGALDNAKLLLMHGAKPTVLGRCGKPAIFYAVEQDDDAMLNWLLSEGLDPEQTDEFSTTALMAAAEHASSACFDLLSAAGADWSRKDHIGETLIQKATDPRIVERIIHAGVNPGLLETDTLRDHIGIGAIDELPVSPEEFEQGRKRRFGTTNPEPMNLPFWKAMVHNGWSGFRAASRFGFDSFSSGEAVWCHDRFGMSLTALPDGRFVQIAGEHEDHYDPDFCIFNDVIVHDGKGDFNILAYPEDVFPPTDFHTATHVDPWIYIIGNLGYPETRALLGPETPVFRLDIRNWSIERVPIKGASPGWIHGHDAELKDDRILITGGKILKIQNDGTLDIQSRSDTWVLCLRSMAWEKTS